MLQNIKRITVLLLVGTLVSLILLSASLSNLQLHAGAPFPGASGSGPEIQFFENPAPANIYSFTILKGIFALIFLVLMIYVPVRLIALITIKRILQLVFVIVATLVIVIAISYIPLDWCISFPDDSIGIATPSSFDYRVSSLGKPPQGLIWLVLIGFVFGAGLLALKVLKLWLDPIGIKEQLLQEAETAVDAIKAGGDLRNVIVRCYMQMVRALQKERRIERRYNMTVREFEAWLEHKGFPIIPLHQLTRLFEKVRYGTQRTMKEDEKAAVESLNEIIQFCRSERNLSQ